MNLYIQLSSDDSTPNWDGFNFIVQPATGTTPISLVLKKCTGGWSWQTIGQIKYVAKKNQMALAIPRKLLGLEPGSANVNLFFKWADNLQNPHDPIDFYLNGDTVPNSRFKYLYSTSNTR